MPGWPTMRPSAPDESWTNFLEILFLCATNFFNWKKHVYYFASIWSLSFGAPFWYSFLILVVVSLTLLCIMMHVQHYHQWKWHEGGRNEWGAYAYVRLTYTLVYTSAPNGSQTICEYVWTGLRICAALSVNGSRTVRCEPKFVGFLREHKEKCAGCPFHAPGVICSPQIREN